MNRITHFRIEIEFYRMAIREVEPILKDTGKIPFVNVVGCANKLLEEFCKFIIKNNAIGDNECFMFYTSFFCRRGIQFTFKGPPGLLRINDVEKRLARFLRENNETEN